MFFKDINFIEVAALIIAGISIYITIKANNKINNLSGLSHKYDLQAILNDLILKLNNLNSEIYLSEHMFNKSPIEENKIKLFNFRNERGTVLGQIKKIISMHPDLASVEVYTELGKNEFTVYNYSSAEFYHKEAIKLSTGISRIICKRSYADFLFRIGRHEEGRNIFSECVSNINSNEYLLNDGNTFKFWMNCEKFIGNHAEVFNLYLRAKNSFEKIEELSVRNHHLSLLEIDRSS